jgi:hypothetical protein
MAKQCVAISIVLGLSLATFGAEPAVRVSGSETRYPTAIAQPLGDQTVRLVLTGTAMRKRYGLNVYAIGSYVQEGTAIRDADALMRAAVVKQLHLVFERDVDGATIAQSFRESIGMNHPAPAFAAELSRLSAFFHANPVQRGDHIWLTSIPGAGLACHLGSKPGVMIANPTFAQAAWEVYLGRKNLGVAIKSGLSSRL